MPGLTGVPPMWSLSEQERAEIRGAKPKRKKSDGSYMEVVWWLLFMAGVMWVLYPIWPVVILVALAGLPRYGPKP